MDAYLFNVIRRCKWGECEPDCNCDLIPVNVDVDELTERELGDFLAHGTEKQKAEIRAYLDEEVGREWPEREDGGATAEAA